MGLDHNHHDPDHHHINHQNQNHDDLLLSCIFPVSPRVGEAELYPDSQDTRWNSLLIIIVIMIVMIIKVIMITIKVIIT